MAATRDDIGRTQARILAALWALEGIAWLDVQGEVHGAYKEVPFWILLVPNTLPIKAHRHFWRVIEPELILFEKYRVTVSYKSIAEGHVLWHGFFDDLDGMRRALTSEGWTKPVIQDMDAANIFRRDRKSRSLARPKKTGRKKTRR